MKTSDNFAAWADWYKNYLSRQLSIDWNTFERLSPDLKAVVGDSVQQFQLGESSEAHHLKAKIARFVKKGGDRNYQEAMEWFIFEENRHARLLGRFMNLEEIPKLKTHFSDQLFRGLRHLANLRYSLVILLSAEIAALPYYTALRDVSDSPILTTICKQILLDEANHIRFQARALRMLLAGKSALRQRMARLTARLLMSMALDVVWFNHGNLFRTVGWEFADFRRESLIQFDWAWDMILTGQEAPETAPTKNAGESRNNRSLQHQALWSDANA